MRPPLWHPPMVYSFAEQTIILHIKRAKLFIFLRDHRHELFDDAFPRCSRERRDRETARFARHIPSKEHGVVLVEGVHQEVGPLLVGGIS